LTKMMPVACTLRSQSSRALLAPVASRWRSVSAQPSASRGTRAGLCGPTTTDRCHPRCKRQILSLAFHAFLRKKVFLLRFTLDSLEMCLGTPSATELITMAFYSLTKCVPRIPAQLPFVSPLS
jgi:hypothetical protein